MNSGLAACAQVCEHGVDAVLVDQAQRGARNTQAHPAVFSLDPETAVLQVRQEPAFGSVVGVGNVVPDHRAFARYVAYACHKLFRNSNGNHWRFCTLRMQTSLLPDLARRVAVTHKALNYSASALLHEALGV